MMRALRITIGKFVTAVLLTLCIGVQVLEITGHWDRTLQDTSDEAVIVIVVLCIGAAVVAAGVMRERLSSSAVRSRIMLVRAASQPATVLRLPSAFCASPPQPLRI